MFGILSVISLVIADLEISGALPKGTGLFSVEGLAILGLTFLAAHLTIPVVRSRTWF